jgi:hypothetical protein
MEVLKRYYLDVRREVLEFVLQVLAVSGRLPNYELLSASLASDSRKERGDAIETIEQGVPRSVFRALLPLVDDRPPAAQAAYYSQAHAPERLTPMQVLEAALQGTRLERLIAAQALCDTGADGVTLLRRRLDALDPDVAAEAFAAITRDPRRAPLTHVEKMFYLRRAHFFSRLRVQESHVIAALVADRHAPDGQAFFGRGDFADTMYCIVEGEVELTSDAGVTRRSTGGVFGEAALGGESLRAEDAVSRGARVLVVPTSRLLLEARNHPRIAAAIFRNALAASAAGASSA